ncbi:MAG: nucleotidyltransferase domain-containing protein [Acidiferrobacterales bacterium]
MIIPKKGIIIPNMGMKNPSLSEALFSKTRRRVLGLLFGNPSRSYYANEVVRFAGVGIGAVQRELERLAAAGLATVTKIGNQKHYQANRQAPIFEEMRGIVLKTFGVGDVLREALAPLADRVHAAFIYGSVAKGTDTASSDIDLMVIGEKLSYADVFPLLTKVETRLGRTINPTVYGRSELRRKLAADNEFLSRVLKQPRILLVGADDALEKPRKSGKNR